MLCTQRRDKSYWAQKTGKNSCLVLRQPLCDYEGDITDTRTVAEQKDGKNVCVLGDVIDLTSNPATAYLWTSFLIGKIEI